MWDCDKCGACFMVEIDKCPCKEFKIVDEGGDEHTVWARDERRAALKYAEVSNEERDYYLMNETVEITVNGEDYKISAEPDVHYSAEPL